MAKTQTLTNRLNILENMYLSDTPFIIREKTKGVSGTFTTAILQLGLVSRRRDGLYTFVAEEPSIEMAETVLAKERTIWKKFQQKGKSIVSTPIQRVTKEPKVVETNVSKTTKKEVVVTQPEVKEYTIRVNSKTKEVTLPITYFMELLK